MIAGGRKRAPEGRGQVHETASSGEHVTGARQAPRRRSGEHNPAEPLKTGPRHRDGVRRACRERVRQARQEQATRHGDGPDARRKRPRRHGDGAIRARRDGAVRNGDPIGSGPHEVGDGARWARQGTGRHPRRHQRERAERAARYRNGHGNGPAGARRPPVGSGLGTRVRVDPDCGRGGHALAFGPGVPYRAVSYGAYGDNRARSRRRRPPARRGVETPPRRRPCP